MLSFNDQYNIMAGIYFVFSNKNSNKRVLSVTHSKQKRDKMKKIFSCNKYETWTKENFIVASLYINFVNKPSSLISSFELLRDLDKKKVYNFKNEIIHYRKFLKEDISNIIMEQNVVTFDYMKRLYRKNEIKWFTFYFYLLATNKDITELNKSRIDFFLYRQIKNMLLYVTFSQKSIDEIKVLLKDEIKI